MQLFYFIVLINTCGIVLGINLAHHGHDLAIHQIRGFPGVDLETTNPESGTTKLLIGGGKKDLAKTAYLKIVAFLGEYLYMWPDFALEWVEEKVINGDWRGLFKAFVEDPTNDYGLKYSSNETKEEVLNNLMENKDLETHLQQRLEKEIQTRKSKAADGSEVDMDVVAEGIKNIKDAIKELASWPQSGKDWIKRWYTEIKPTSQAVRSIIEILGNDRLNSFHIRDANRNTKSEVIKKLLDDDNFIESLKKKIEEI